jgi:hypothetical protein
MNPNANKLNIGKPRAASFTLPFRYIIQPAISETIELFQKVREPVAAELNPDNLAIAGIDMTLPRLS